MIRGAAPASFDRSFDDLAAVAYRVAYRLLGSRPDAEDVAQEALARAFARWRRIERHAEPWVARVAANLAIDALRRRSRRPTAVLDEADGRPSDEAAFGSSLDRMELVRLLGDLPRRQREVVVLRYLADLSEAATAQELGTSVGTVKQHAHRGLAALRIGWAELDADSVPESLTNPGAH